MTATLPCLHAVLDAVHIALPLTAVDRVLRAVAVHAAPASAGCLLGAIDVAGELVPVYELRKLVGLPARGLPLRLTDRIVLTRQPVRCGLVVDAAPDTMDVEAPTLTGEFPLHAAGLRGWARSPSGLVLLQDLRQLLALQRAVPIAAHG